jgi:hypothetical protein
MEVAVTGIAEEVAEAGTVAAMVAVGIAGVAIAVVGKVEEWKCLKMI